MSNPTKTMLGIRPVVYEHEIERAVQHQLEIERKAAAWDLLTADMREKCAKADTDARAMLTWMDKVKRAAARVCHG